MGKIREMEKFLDAAAIQFGQLGLYCAEMQTKAKLIMAEPHDNEVTPQMTTEMANQIWDALYVEFRPGMWIAKGCYSDQDKIARINEIFDAGVKGSKEG